MVAFERFLERLPCLDRTSLLFVRQADVEPRARVVGGHAGRVAIGGEGVLLLEIDRPIRCGIRVVVRVWQRVAQLQRDGIRLTAKRLAKRQQRLVAPADQPQLHADLMQLRRLRVVRCLSHKDSAFFLGSQPRGGKVFCTEG